MSGDHKTIINGNPSQYVKLNVGGHLFYTTIATLTAKPDTMLQAMFSGRMEVLTDSEGIIVHLISAFHRYNSDIILFPRLDSNRSLRYAFWHNYELSTRWHRHIT